MARTARRWKRDSRCLLLATAWLLWLTADARAQVLIQGVQTGQGVLRARGKACFVLTPYHVIENASGPVTIVGAQSVEASAVLQRKIAEDLAILNVKDATGLGCEEWLPLGNFSAMLQSQGNGFLSIREQDGSRTQLAVTINAVDDELIHVQPSTAGAILEGMSGASLIVNGSLAGLLLNVTKGEGAVLRLDNIVRLSDPFFVPESSAAPRKPELDLGLAQSVLDRAAKARDGSQQGQAEALGALLGRGHSFDSADWSGINLHGAVLSHGSFKQARLHAVDLSEARAVEADLSGAGLRFASLERAEMTGVVLAGSYAPFVRAQGALFQGADASGATFFGADFRGARFTKAKLQGTSLAFADLRGAVFDGADLTGAYLIGAIMDAKTSFAGAVVKETDVLGAAAAAVTFSPAQRAGLCRHANGARDMSLIWEVHLTERSNGSRPDGAAEYRELAPVVVGFASFGDRTLPLCSSKTDAAAAFDSRFAGRQDIQLDRDYLDKAGRRARISEQVTQHGALLRASLLPSSNLSGSNDETRTWEQYMTDAGRRIQPVAAPYANADQVVLMLLQAGLVDAAKIRWQPLAQARYRFESAAAQKQESLSLHSMWPAFFPPGAPWEDLPGDPVKRYQEWTLARVAAAPMMLVARGPVPGAGGPGAPKGLLVSAAIPGVTLDNTGDAGWPSGLSEYLRKSNIDAKRVGVLRIRTLLEPLGSVAVVLPDAIGSYTVPRPSDPIPSGAVLEVELTIDRIELARLASYSSALMFATPGTVRVRAGGKVVWTGPAVHAGP